MPRRAPRPCSHPGCPNLVREPGERYCAEHRAQHTRQYDRDRGSAAARGYGARWRRLRTMVLARQPICADPFGIHAARGEVVASTDVDHIVPRRRGGRDTMENLQGLCHECHSRKTATQDGGFGG